MVKLLRFAAPVALVVAVLIVGTVTTPLAQSEYIRQIDGGLLIGPGNSQTVLLGTEGKGYLRVAVGGAITFPNSATVALPAGSSFTSPTLTTPIITAPSGASSTGLMITKSARFVEAAAATSYTATVAIPAGAVIHSITLIAEVLWNGTSATAKVGDTANDDGFFVGVNLKATDLLVNEVLSVLEDSLWGGKEGAYLVAATGQRGPTTTNFGLYYAAGSNITCIITPGAADGTAGRTVFSVTYSVGEVLTVVVV